MNPSNLIGALEAIAEDQRLLCLSLDAMAMHNEHPTQQAFSLRAVANFAEQAEDRLARLIDDLKATQDTTNAAA